MNILPTTVAAVAAGLVLLGGLGAPAGLSAQEPGGTTVREGPRLAGAPPVRDAEMAAFADAWLAIAELRRELERRLEEVADPERSRALQRATAARIRGVVTESPLTLERYGQIGRLVYVDPGRRAQLRSLLRSRGGDMRAGAPGG